MVWVGRARSFFGVKEDFTAGVAGGFERSLDEVNETNVNHRKFQLNVSKVTRRFVVLATVSWADESRFDNTHVRVHQALLVGVSVVLVGVCSLNFNSRHLLDFNRVHQSKSDLSNPLGNHCCFSAHLRSSSSRRMATPKLFISSRSSLNAYEVCTL